MSIIESIEYFPLFDAEPGDEPAGVSVAVGSGVAALGVPNALGGSGAVVLYFYSEQQNAWGYAGVLTGSKIAGTEQVRALGSSCAAFGNRVVVGAHGDEGTPGRVFVLSPPYGAWSYTAIPVVAELAHREPARGDKFGASVAHCFDGTDHYIAVGAPGLAPGRGKTGGGQVFIFRGLDASSTPWSSSPIANPNSAGTPDDRFGATVAINPSSDGSGGSDGTLTLAVGAPATNGGEGAVYVGRTTERGKWAFQWGEPLIPTFPDAAEDFHTEGFGASVALTGGATLVVGSPLDPNFDDMIEGTGAVWVFRSADGEFVSSEVQNRIYGPAEGMQFGASLDFPETSPDDGTLPQARRLVIGAPGAVSDQPTCAFLYSNDLVDGEPAGASFTQEAVFISSSPQDGDGFGGSVAASDYELGGWCMVGAAGNPKAEIPGGGFLYAEGQPAPAWMEMPELVTASPASTLRWGGMPPDWWKKFTPRIEKYLD
jgi:hypothetical protein